MTTLGRLGATARTLRTFTSAVLSLVTAAVVVPSCTATARVSDAWMSLDEDGARHRNVFYTDTKEIFCIAEVAIGRSNATLEMQLRRVQTYDFEKNGVVNVDTVSSYQEQKPEPAPDRKLVTLRVPRTAVNASGELVESDTAAFVPGRLACEISLDGVLEKTVPFNIQFPPCPTEEIRPGSVCSGFYPAGQTCPRSGVSGAPNPTCKCGDTGWEC